MSKENQKAEMTKEELAKNSQEYYDWLESVYHIGSFEIQGRNGETLHFYHGFNTKSKEDEKFLCYFLVDEDYIEYYEKRKALHLQGENIPESEKKDYKSKGFVCIDEDKKYFNFGIEWDYQGHGYGKAIYNNIPHILEMLGIEDKEKYQLRLYGNPNHDFFKRIATQELVAKTNCEPNTEKALQIIQEFAKYPNTMRFSELNTIIEYALNSGVPREQIAQAINDNGFNIVYYTVNFVPHFEEEDFRKFKSFGITGLKPTCMHQHFMRNRNFGFMRLLGDVDMQDATVEFKRVFEEIKAEHEKSKTEGGYIPSNLKKFGELEYIILDWDCFGLLLKDVNPDIQQIVKKQAIERFGGLDPEHKHPWGVKIDSYSETTFEVLRDAGLMNKDTYIELYQKALNRNYNLQEFDRAVYWYIDRNERELAREEISKNTYYPSPKRNWQKSNVRGEEHKVPHIMIPQSIRKERSASYTRNILKQEILRQGIARKTKIKTDMTGIGKDGKPFVVNNLKDWLFGVPGAYGNLQMAGNGEIVLPPQTPKFAIDLIKKAFKDIEDPDLDELE